MQGNRSRDTKPEVAVRRLLHAGGMRYRVNFRPVPNLRRTADIVFTRARVAVFIDGCYWHGCPVHYRSPASNVDYWSAKIARNRARDIETTEHLRADGWTVLRFWAHEDPAEVAKAVTRAILGARMPAANQPNICPPSKGSGTEPPAGKAGRVGNVARGPGLKLNVYISSAADGLLTVKAVQMPELSVQVGTLEEIPESVSAAAASMSGEPAEDFVVIIDF